MKKCLILSLLAVFCISSPAVAASYFIDLTNNTTYSDDPNGWTTKIFYGDDDEYSLTITKKNSMSSFEEGIGYIINNVDMLINTAGAKLTEVQFFFDSWEGQIEYWVLGSSGEYRMSMPLTGDTYFASSGPQTNDLVGKFHLFSHYNHTPLVLTGIKILQGTTAVPVPAAFWLMGSAIIGLGLCRKKLTPAG